MPTLPQKRLAKKANRGVLWRFVTTSARDRPGIVLSRHSSSGSLRASSLASNGVFGAGWGRCGPQARLAPVSLASSRQSPGDWWLETRCVSAPHDGMRRRRKESHGWRGLLRSGRVVESREDGGSLTASAAGLVRLRVQTWVALATANGQARERVSERVRATRGGERQSTEAPGHRIRAPCPEQSVRSVWTRRACFAGTYRLGGSSAR